MAALTVEEVGRAFDRVIRRDQNENYEFSVGPTDRIVGVVARSEFRNLGVGDRLSRVREFIVREFGERADEIGLVFAFTPEEYAEYVEDRLTA